MTEDIDIVETISELLDSEKYKDALKIATEEKYAANFKDNCWDLISTVVSKIGDETILLKPSLYGTCEELLSLVLHKSSPEEALLEFIERVEVAKNEGQLCIVIPFMQKLLKIISIRKGCSLQWCLGAITNYIETIPIPDIKLEGKQRLLIDCDKNVRRITKSYSLIPTFYRSFMEELMQPDSSVMTKQTVCAFLISLFGKPLIYIDIDALYQKNSELRQICGTIIYDVCRLEKNVFKFLQYIEPCYKENLKTNTESVTNYGVEKAPYEQTEKINLTSLGGFYYAVIAGQYQIPDTAIPQVYSAEYIADNILLCIIHLLTFTESGPLYKALSLLKTILDRIPQNISHQSLCAPLHFDLCKNLMNVSIYCNIETLRKDTINMIGGHIDKFDYKGRTMLIKYILETSNHSGMIGYSIVVFKNSINEAFKHPELPDCFTGLQFYNMLKKICYLPHGPESDLVELADQIIPSLNLLRFLAIKDVENRTGIKDFFTLIESEYLDKLRVGLNMSKAHYEVKLKDLQEGKQDSQKEMNISISVSGNMLDGIPIKNQIELIQSALNAFHLMEGIIGRLSECMSINKMQESHYNPQ